MSHRLVLVVEDDPLLILESCEALRRHGFEVVGVNSAAAALIVMGEHPRLLAMVTDVDLGVGCDGFGLARRARASNARLPVVFVSGMASARQMAADVERSEFIDKPFHPSEIVEALGRVVLLSAS